MHHTKKKKKKKSETVDHVCLFVLQVGVVGEYFSSLFTVQRLQSTIYPAWWLLLSILFVCYCRKKEKLGNSDIVG